MPRSAEHGQCVALPAWDGATVGGVLAVGHSGIRRLGYGPVRDTLLQARYVSAEGRVVKAGGPTVKNVSGYDLCRLLVGSLGTVGLIGEVILRTRPIPAASRWFTAETADPSALVAALYRPASVLWDGARAWALLEGHPADVEALASASGLAPTDAPPALPPHRWSISPTEISALRARSSSRWAWASCTTPSPNRLVRSTQSSQDLSARIRRLFDPEHRLNPGRDVLAA